MELTDGLNLLRFFLALFVVLGLLGALSYVGKRFLRPKALTGLKQDKSIKVLEEMNLDQGRRLMLVGVDQSKALLLLSPRGDHIQTLPNQKGQSS